MFTAKLRQPIACLTLFFYVMAYVNVAYAAPQSSGQATCQLKRTVCVDANSTKVINGVSVHKACWAYQNEYECLEPNSANFCSPLKRHEAKCEVQGQNCLEEKNGECLRYEHQYSCDVNLKTLHNGRLPEKVRELEHTHLITSDWDSSQCDKGGKRCQQVSARCIEGKETRVINGVPVTRECWKEERTMQCSNNTQNVNECTAFDQNASCHFKQAQCVHTLPDGSCQIKEKTYSCTESTATSKQVSTCVDKDFSKTMTAMEMSREMQRFYDPDKQRFFNGEANYCSIKLGGALDGVLGGDCCKTKAEPSKLKDFVVQQGTTMAAQHLMSSVASHYTYTTLTGQAANYMATAMSSTGVTGVAASTSSVTGGIGAYGFTVGPAASGGGLTVAFDPVSFGVAISVMALQQWLKCGQDETLTAMKRKADLCHYVGSYCDSKVLGACVKKKEAQCCYVSKLAKIVNVGGKQQLGLSFGTPKAPTCEGFTAQEMEKLDFSKLDLSDFYQEIYANMESVGKQTGNAAKGAQKSIQQGQNLPVKNYYE